MFLEHEQDVTERYFIFSQGSNGAGKMNSYLNMPVYRLISPSNIKYENKINHNYRAPYTHISNRKGQ